MADAGDEKPNSEVEELNSDEDDDQGDDDRINTAEGVLVPKTSQKYVRAPTGVWEYGQDVAIENYIKREIYKAAPILDTSVFRDGEIFKLFEKELRMDGKFSQAQQKSIIAMTKYRLDQTRSRDRKIAFKNMSK